MAVPDCHGRCHGAKTIAPQRTVPVQLRWGWSTLLSSDASRRRLRARPAVTLTPRASPRRRPLVVYRARPAFLPVNPVGQTKCSSRTEMPSLRVAGIGALAEAKLRKLRQRRSDLMQAKKVLRHQLPGLRASVHTFAPTQRPSARIFTAFQELCTPHMRPSGAFSWMRSPRTSVWANRARASNPFAATHPDPPRQL